MASSSQVDCSSPPPSDPCWKYDVFLSFRGHDTRKGITVDIHDRLNRSGIKTFMDEHDLQVGDVISPTLLAAIKESKFAIVVLSQNYASSAWCLEELREICLSMEDNRIFPLFYEVEPTSVRYQKESFEKDFSNHETSGRHESEKVNQWKSVLNKVANISGWNTNDYKTHKELVNIIVEFLRSKVLTDAIESTGDFKAFESTRKTMEEVKKALKDKMVTAVGVYGMGGVGKTTMVKHVGAEARNNGIFDHVIMAIISQTPDVRKIQGTLADLLRVELKEETEIGRATRVSEEIMRRNKILIILDDIWERMDLSRIGIPSYQELQKCNSKVLFTTRIKNVCHVMNCQKQITLKILSEEDSWALFVRNARRSFETITFQSVAKKVAGECKGLPIALIAVARALGDKDLVEWQKAIQRLQKSQTANLDDKGDAFECLKLSYDYLRGADCKSCFLLCCLFPEDYEIKIEDLFRYAVGKGLFQDADTLEEAREKVDSVATHLKHSCLLMDGRNNKFVRMHDVVRDTAIRIAQSEDGCLVRAGCGLKDWPSQFHGAYSSVSLMANHIRKLPEKLVCPKLQILLLNSNPTIGKIPETFFQSPDEGQRQRHSTCELKVLDFSMTHISVLPETFSFLTNLRALYLDRCYLIDISMIRELKKLELLSMRNSDLKKFPREIRGLSDLKMLDITGTRINTIPPNVVSELCNLEELYMHGLSTQKTNTSMYGLCELYPQFGFWDWRNEVVEDGEETKARFDEVINLSKLRVLEVWISDAECIPRDIEFNPNWVYFDIRIGTYDRIMAASDRYARKSISLKTDTISRLPGWFFDAVMNVAERLRWERCPRLIEMFVECEHGRLQGLKHLCLIGMDCIEPMNTVIWVPRKPVLENLEELHLEWVDCLELCIGKLTAGSLFNLKFLYVKFCHNWGKVLIPSNLPNLEELNCSSTDGIKYVFGYEASFEPKVGSKLKKIELSDLNTLTSMCYGPALPGMFQALQSLTITQCNNLKGSLFTYDVAQCLSQLNYFELHDCPNIVRIVEASNKTIILPKLKKLGLKELPSLYYESATFDIECPSLEYLELSDCPRFSASFSDFHRKKQVQLKRMAKRAISSSSSEDEYETESNQTSSTEEEYEEEVDRTESKEVASSETEDGSQTESQQNGEQEPSINLCTTLKEISSKLKRDKKGTSKKEQTPPESDGDTDDDSSMYFVAKRTSLKTRSQQRKIDEKKCQKQQGNKRRKK